MDFFIVFSVYQCLKTKHQKMSDTTTANFQSCCRLCLSDKADVLKSVFDESNEDRLLPQKISQFIAIQVCKSTVLATILFLFSSLIVENLSIDAFLVWWNIESHKVDFAIRNYVDVDLIASSPSWSAFLLCSWEVAR